MRDGWGRRLGVAALSLACGVLPAAAQTIQLGDLGSGQPASRRQHVELETHVIHVPANRPEWVEVRFRIDPGIHINSHQPKDELLLPTTLDLNGAGQVKIVGWEYPAGIPLRLDIGEGEVLSTYQGEFRVLLQVVARPGDAALSGTLHYQACDTRSCYPAKTLPVHVAVQAK